MLLRYRTECPHCGNEITVTNEREEQKCVWCRRPISVKLEKIGKKKIKCEVEPVEFSESQKQEYKKQSYSRWKDKDIYGRN